MLQGAQLGDGVTDMRGADVDADQTAEVALDIGNCRVDGPNEALGRWGHNRNKFHSSCETLEGVDAGVVKATQRGDVAGESIEFVPRY